MIRQITDQRRLQVLENGNGAILHSVEVNLVDRVWSGSRPPLPSGDLLILTEQYCGKSFAVMR